MGIKLYPLWANRNGKIKLSAGFEHLIDVIQALEMAIGINFIPVSAQAKVLYSVQRRNRITVLAQAKIITHQINLLKGYVRNAILNPPDVKTFDGPERGHVSYKAVHAGANVHVLERFVMKYPVGHK